mmetsp:Transcript_12752/g.37902  ORF Transcript_12752/g.37902 Transcript_12752/m.37902 type:complete len:487 (-) Transcript_12752:354-1814(-)
MAKFSFRALIVLNSASTSFRAASLCRVSRASFSRSSCACSSSFFASASVRPSRCCRPRWTTATSSEAATNCARRSLISFCRSSRRPSRARCTWAVACDMLCSAEAVFCESAATRWWKSPTLSGFAPCLTPTRSMSSTRACICIATLSTMAFAFRDSSVSSLRTPSSAALPASSRARASWATADSDARRSSASRDSRRRMAEARSSASCLSSDFMVSISTSAPRFCSRTCLAAASVRPPVARMAASRRSRSSFLELCSTSILLSISRRASPADAASALRSASCSKRSERSCCAARFWTVFSLSRAPRLSRNWAFRAESSRWRSPPGPRGSRAAPLASWLTCRSPASRSLLSAATASSRSAASVSTALWSSETWAARSLTSVRTSPSTSRERCSSLRIISSSALAVVAWVDLHSSQRRASPATFSSSSRDRGSASSCKRWKSCESLLSSRSRLLCSRAASSKAWEKWIRSCRVASRRWSRSSLTAPAT